jgi:hypothetical protein
VSDRFIDFLPEPVVPHERVALEALRTGRVPAILTYWFACVQAVLSAVWNAGPAKAPDDRSLDVAALLLPRLP